MPKRQNGFVTIQWMFALLISMILVVVLVNMAMSYLTLGAVRNMAADAVRAGSRAAATPEQVLQRCDAEMQKLQTDDGPWRGQVQLSPCEYDAASRRVSVETVYCPRSWLPSSNFVGCADGGVGLGNITVRASQRVEFIETQQ